jgi:hypothetical protein
MDMPFYFFFGLLGLAIGALVVWLLLADHPFEGPEQPVGPVDEVEATIIAGALAKRGRPVDEETVVGVIGLHNAYLEGTISQELAPTAADAAASSLATATTSGRGVRTRKSAPPAEADEAGVSAAEDPARSEPTSGPPTDQIDPQPSGQR